MPAQSKPNAKTMTEREERTAAALRENLRKRKLQAEQRKTEQEKKTSAER